MEGGTEASCSNNLPNALEETVEDMSLRENEVGIMDVEDSSMMPPRRDVFVDGLGCLGDIDFNSLTADEVRQFYFGDLQAAYDFYNEYGRIKGFSIRRSKVGRNFQGEIIWQTFLCSREGMRERKYLERTDRKREARTNIRCGCNAKMRVHMDFKSGRWYVSIFSDEHNHELLNQRFIGMLRSHRNMRDGDIDQMNSMRRGGISIPKIYGSIANQCEGYHMIRFGIKDMYNQLEKQRRIQDGDAIGAFRYLENMKRNDSLMFWRHTVDGSSKLQHLFWCDGSSQRDYSIFGDVLRFDATYGRNKYKCPVVVFSGVNHHMHTTVFGCAILADETEESYVWLLRQFVDAMKGKCPKSVITDGDLAMRNSIRIVLPDAHHRLCSWHLLRNASTNVKKPKFCTEFRKCMMGDYEVEEFEEMWDSVVSEFGLEDNAWVRDLYQKKGMWANAHIRGKFFGGFRTTSRCEALHMQIGKYINRGYNLTEFIEHFQHYLEFMRSKEVEADYRSCYGEPILKTKLEALERYGHTVYTREVFHVFREVLMMSSDVKVVGHKQTSSGRIYGVTRYCHPRKMFHVSFYPTDMEIRCSCLRMESLGIPCSHIVGVMVYLDIAELPKCVILNRWTKKAKASGISQLHVGREITDHGFMSMYASMLDDCRDLCKLACQSFEVYYEVKDRLANERAALRAMRGTTDEGVEGRGANHGVNIRDPTRVRYKGCGKTRVCGTGRLKRIQRCARCRNEGHNSRRCPLWSQEIHGDGHAIGFTVNSEDDKFDHDVSTDEEGSEAYSEFNSSSAGWRQWD